MNDIATPALSPLPRRPVRGRVAVVAVALLAMLGTGVAVVAGGDDSPARLALVAGSAGDAMAVRSAAPEASGFERSMMPYPYGGIEYRVEGRLPDLGREAPAWALHTPGLDRDDVDRLARALGLAGAPTARDGGWVLEAQAGSLSVFPTDDGWSVNFYHQDRAAQTGSGSLTPSAAEAAARALLARMDVPGADWEVRTSTSEMGYGCAMPADLGTRGVEIDTAEAAEAGKLEEEARTSGNGADGAAPADMVACPPPAPPTVLHHVSFSPVLEGIRADWSAWGVTIGQDGRVENLYGMWVSFERAGDFKLRTVDDALAELRSGSGDLRIQSGAVDVDAGAAVGGTEPAVAVLPEPALAPDAVSHPAMPPDAMPPVPAEPMVVTITGASRSLISMGVYAGDAHRLHLVPAYRFTGTFAGGEAYETVTVALHPDAIAPPPATAVTPPPDRAPMVEPGRPEPLTSQKG